MAIITMDHGLAALQATLIHPTRSMFIAAAALLLRYATSTTRVVGAEGSIQSFRSFALVALGCVALSWMLQLNRMLNRKALNPSPKVSCNWAKEVVVVTGGSGGIGKELVGKLESLSATVAILDASPPDFKIGKKTHYFKTDVRSFQSILDTRDKITAKLGSATMLVASAGLLRARTILNSSEDDLRTTFDVNVFGFLFSIKAFLPAMIKADRGQVLVISSVTAYSIAASISCYSASKAAVCSLVEGVQTELKHKHGNPRVKISALIPGPVKTDMHDKFDLTVSEGIMPYLQPSQVAERICQILSRGESAISMMPSASNMTPVLHALPHWVRVAAQDLGAGATRHLNESKSQ